MTRRTADESRERPFIRAAANANLLVSGVVTFLLLTAGVYLRGPGLNGTTLPLVVGGTILAVGGIWFFRSLAG